MSWRDIALNVVLPFLLSLTVILIVVSMKERGEPHADEYTYLWLGADLNKHGTLTNGPFSENGEVGRPGRFLAPTYPYLLHILSLFDETSFQTITCYSPRPPKDACPIAFGSLLGVQVVLASFTALFIYLIALLLSRSAIVSWLTLTIVLATQELSYYASKILTETSAFFFLFGFLLALVWGLKSGRPMAYAMAGLAIAFAALTRPSYMYLLYATALTLALLALCARRMEPKVMFGHLVLFVGIGIVVLLPWALRNWTHFGDPAITAGYGPYILAQRVTFNQMTWAEWAVSWIFWLPDFGDSLAEALFAPELYQKLGFYTPESYFLQGNALMAELKQRLPDTKDQFNFLVQNYILTNPIKHVIVSASLTVRGMWVGKYLAIVGLLLLIPAGLLSARRGVLALFLAFAGALLFMAALHGLVTVNVPRYNAPLIALYGYIVVFWLIYQLERAWRAPWWRHA